MRRQPPFGGEVLQILSDRAHRCIYACIRVSAAPISWPSRSRYSVPMLG
jgi:hypothetical protein